MIDKYGLYRKNIIEKIILFFNFSDILKFGPNWPIGWTEELFYDVEILIKIQKHCFCSINMGDIGKMSSTKSVYLLILQ